MDASPAPPREHAPGRRAIAHPAFVTTPARTAVTTG